MVKTNASPPRGKKSRNEMLHLHVGADPGTATTSPATLGKMTLNAASDLGANAGPPRTVTRF
jgi:hypothetical protein